MPKAVRASVTMSEVVPRSSPDAAARFMMPSTPSSMSFVFQPAMAMYSKADPASEAENFVFAPISRALSRRSCRSSPVAPEIACTFDICASKSEVVLTAAVPRATTGAVTVVVSVLPTPASLFPADSNFFPVSSIFSSAAYVVDTWDSRFLRACSVSSISRCRASYLSCPSVPFSSCCFACSCAVLSVSSLSFVAPMASFRRRCFWARSSVLDGSSFKSFSTSFSSVCVDRIVVLTPLRLFSKEVVSAESVKVRPFILEAICQSLLSLVIPAIKEEPWDAVW